MNIYSLEMKKSGIAKHFTFLVVLTLECVSHRGLHPNQKCELLRLLEAARSVFVLVLQSKCREDRDKSLAKLLTQSLKLKTRIQVLQSSGESHR